MEGMIGYRIQPYVNFAMNVSYNEIRLPAPFEKANFWLLGPKMDLTFSDKVFLSTFVQYNEQIENMNINMRFQWRYAPVSDFFHRIYRQLLYGGLDFAEPGTSDEAVVLV